MCIPGTGRSVERGSNSAAAVEAMIRVSNTTRFPANPLIFLRVLRKEYLKKLPSNTPFEISHPSKYVEVDTMRSEEQPYDSHQTGPAPRTYGAKIASIICLLAGIWFFVSPWVYNSYTKGNSWNSWIVGAVIFILGCIRAARPSAHVSLSWLSAVLGIWAFFSPWIYGYVGNEGRFINSLCVGVIVFVFAIASGLFTHRRSMQTVPHAM